MPFDAFVLAKKLSEGNIEPPNLEKVIKSINKKEKNTRKKGVSSKSLDFSEWGSLLDKLANLYIYEPIMLNLLAVNKIKFLENKIKVK